MKVKRDPMSGILLMGRVMAVAADRPNLGQDELFCNAQRIFGTYILCNAT